MAAPAFLNLAATVLSSDTLAPTRAYKPAVLSISSTVAMLSLSRIGMPCNGPMIVPFV